MKTTYANHTTGYTEGDPHDLESAIIGSWSKISPFWPLKNLIATNPIAGFEGLPFEEGLRQGKAYFQQKDIPKEMHHVNRESIKWLQVFFDAGQATFPMPNRHLGFWNALRPLIVFDEQIHQNEPQKREWVRCLPETPERIIQESLASLGIPEEMWELFLTLLLTTLPGWAAYIQYRTNWADAEDASHPHTVTQSDYLAFRLVVTRLLFPQAKQLITWHQRALDAANVRLCYDDMVSRESRYQSELLQKLHAVRSLVPPHVPRPKAQLVFCIDVRSEPFRRALEGEGDYDTYGFAGFFGLPVAIHHAVTDERYASCPVLLKPVHEVTEHPTCSSQSCQSGYKRMRLIKKLYQSLKYTFTAPFALVETLGLTNGLWMALKILSPNIVAKLEKGLGQTLSPSYELVPDSGSIPLAQQCAYGLGALKMMGLVENFAPLVVFCGHGSTTQNNAYATALDCGACGGRHGAPNARILAAILNTPTVRQTIAQQGVLIPEDTLFVAAEHNTTTDEVSVYDAGVSGEKAQQLADLKKDLIKARDKNSAWRAQEMGLNVSHAKAWQFTALRSRDWAQVRPEWGLARNAAFIVAPRQLTRQIALEGRSFLHSYAWQNDPDGASLTTILTAPMVVAQWINAQYLFSTLDNVAFGGGSKITKNITGKIGVMQGNASDLMHGLPLQSVYQSDREPYHSPMRLTVIVYAPKSHIDPIVEKQPVLQKLFGNGWVHLICQDPQCQKQFRLQRDFTWVSCD